MCGRINLPPDLPEEITFIIGKGHSKVVCIYNMCIILMCVCIHVCQTWGNSNRQSSNSISNSNIQSE